MFGGRGSPLADTVSLAEMLTLQAELKRVTEDLDILKKKAAAHFTQLSG